MLVVTKVRKNYNGEGYQQMPPHMRDIYIYIYIYVTVPREQERILPKGRKKRKPPSSSYSLALEGSRVGTRRSRMSLAASLR